MRNLFFATLFTLVLAPLQSFAFTPDCENTEETGNSITTDMREGLMREYEGDTLEITSSQKLTIKGFESLEFNGCDFSMWVTFDLKREVVGDTSGRIQLAGQVKEVDDKHICLEKITAPKLELEGASDVEVDLYRQIATMALPKEDCFKWSSSLR